MAQVVTFLAVFWRCLVQILVKTPAALASVPHSLKSSAGRYLKLGPSSSFHILSLIILHFEGL